MGVEDFCCPAPRPLPRCGAGDVVGVVVICVDVVSPSSLFEVAEIVVFVVVVVVVVVEGGSSVGEGGRLRVAEGGREVTFNWIKLPSLARGLRSATREAESV